MISGSSFSSFEMGEFFLGFASNLSLFFIIIIIIYYWQNFSYEQCDFISVMKLFECFFFFFIT
jgi:hypothetical protein